MITNEDLKIKDIYELPGEYTGFYSDNVILIDKTLNQKDKLAIFYEELAHHKFTYGDITKNDDPLSQMFENKAQYRAMEDAIPLSLLIEISQKGIYYISDMADYLELPSEYVFEVLIHYQRKYGQYKRFSNYLIYFNPLHVKEVE